jgi:hypothetical protein
VLTARKTLPAICEKCQRERHLFFTQFQVFPPDPDAKGKRDWGIASRWLCVECKAGIFERPKMRLKGGT